MKTEQKRSDPPPQGTKVKKYEVKEMLRHWSDLHDRFWRTIATLCSLLCSDVCDHLHLVGRPILSSQVCSSHVFTWKIGSLWKSQIFFPGLKMLPLALIKIRLGHGSCSLLQKPGTRSVILWHLLSLNFLWCQVDSSSKTVKPRTWI